MDALPPPSSSVPIADIKKLRSQLSLRLSKFNTHITHLNRLLVSTPHLDALLSLITYTLTFVTSLPRFSPSPISPFPKRPGPKPRLVALLTLLSDLRITLRLPALLSIYTLTLSTLSSPPRDPYLRLIAYSQLLASTIFQTLENVAYLGDKGVLRSPKTQKWWLWSCRAWALSVMLEGGRLGREWALEGQERKGSEQRERGGSKQSTETKEGQSGEGREKERDEDGEKESKVRQARRARRWWAEVVSNVAYAPLTLHWSLERGLLGEGWVGALGMVAGFVGVREAWRGVE